MTTTEPTWRAGDWMQTFTDREFWPLDPRPEDVDPVDIAHALSLLCRFNGHVSRFYSVAEHCVLLSNAVAPEHALWALLHDATEAYVGDMIRPLKRHMPDYVAAEYRVMVAIAERFGIEPIQPDEVTLADSRILIDERDALLGEPNNPWAVDELGRLDVDIVGLPPHRAEFLYLQRLEQLGVAVKDEAGIA